MNLVSQLKAERRVQKLRTANRLDAEDLRRVEDELAAMGPAAIGPMLRCLSHGEARKPALRILERLVGNETLDTYVEALSSPNPVIASGVTQVLAKSRSFDATRLIALLTAPRPAKPTLEAILREHAPRLPARGFVQIFPKLEKDGQAVVFRLLEKTDNVSVLPDLVRLLEHEDWWVRTNAARLLGRHAQPPVIQALTGRLQDPHKNVRYEAVCALHALKATDAVPALVACLRDADYRVQAAAIDTLIEVADASAVRHLLEILTDESEYARRGAVEVLNEVATPEAIQDLLRSLRDQDWWVRVRAADALGALGGDKVVDAVIGLLGDSDDLIRRHAVEILNAVPSRRAAEALVTALDDPDWWVRERSIDALAKAGDPCAVEPLLRLLDSDPGTLSLCARALGALGDGRAVKPLIELVESEREEVRHEAVDALRNLIASGLPEAERGLVQAALSRMHRPATPSPRPSAPAPAAAAGHQRMWDGEARQPTACFGVAIPPRAESPHPTRPAAASTPSSPQPAGPRAATLPGPALFTDFANLGPGTALLGRYHVKKKIGKGGFGAVYLVEDAIIHDDVILKILNPQLSSDANALERFIRELKLTRRITHKNVIRLHDFMDLGGTHAVSMEYFPSRDLGQALAEDGPLEVRRALRIMVQVCAGLTAAHAEGVVHRDLKPANILVGLQDDAKIVDFGLASCLQMAESRLTKSGLLIGTPEYMAPEQISGDSVDGRADIYALGIVMYELLSGVKPFVADSPVKVLFLHLEGDIPPLHDAAPGISESVEQLVVTAMRRDVEARPASVEQLQQRIVEELEALGASG
jgi:serine/threonine-protein kinase